jgi:3-oxoacyl-[acyl-carrier protein] reductase
MATAIVTGAGRGIGRAVALALAARGLDVALLGRTDHELEEVAADINALGRSALALRCDVASALDVDGAARASIERFGAPSVVVNNAGIVRRAAIEEMRESDWDEVIDVNLKGAFLVTRAFLPSMRAVNAGRIVHVGSISSTLGTARASAYCASKWGLIGFMKSLAEELAGSPLVTMAVLPGSVDTEMLKGSGYEPKMKADDVARTIVFAALDAPSAMNGSAIEMFG